MMDPPRQAQLSAPLRPGVTRGERRREARLAKRVPALPADREVDTPGELVIFDPDDIQLALAIFRASEALDPIAAMRETMLHTLRIAAMNLDVR